MPVLVSYWDPDKQSRVEQAYERVDDNRDYRICVRVNKDMIVDAILAKARRKALKAVYETLTGSPADAHNEEEETF